MFGASARPYLIATAIASVAGLALSGCSAGKVLKTSDDDHSASAAPKTFEATLRMNVRPGDRGVEVDRKVRVRITGGQLQNVTVKGPGGTVPGKLATNSAVWRATGLLRPAAHYTVSGLAVGDNGVPRRSSARSPPRS